ncbi:MAG TPA: globin [Acidimicrobiales bacterium]|nr:globin [Acidimicrobiales bacterium]
MEQSLYDQVGGEPFFERLVEGFYAAVESDEILRPMYPEDLTESKRHLVLFLMQYWGGPRSYMEERGHPRLRMRHAPFEINKRARDAWLQAMSNALASVRSELSDEQYTEMTAYFDMAARQLRNV